MTKVSLSRAWDETKEICDREGRLLAMIALALFVLPRLIVKIVMPEWPAGELPSPGPWIGVSVVAGWISMVGQLAITRLAFEPSLTFTDAISHGARRFPPYFSATVLWLLPLITVGALLVVAILQNPEKVSIAAIIGFSLLLIVALYFSVWFQLVLPVASAEHVGPIVIIERSWALTAGNWWRLFTFSFLLFTVEAVIEIGVKSTVGVFGPMTIGRLLLELPIQLLKAVISVVFFVMLARIYAQLSGREAVD